ncbi:MAG: S41 family peptidase [Phycisphaeraceae bacterium]|nr:MAG: S41 family peptidase [Phycisphaeraceae bacterium]
MSMYTERVGRGVVWSILAGLLACGAPTSSMAAEPQADAVAVAARNAPSLSEWADRLWSSAKRDDTPTFLGLLADPPAGHTSLSASASRLKSHFAAREDDRAQRLEAARTDMTKHMDEAPTAVSLSKALVSAMEIYELSKDPARVLDEPQVRELVRRADAAARDAEAKGEWLSASELFIRLSLLMEESPDAARYKSDAQRLTHRLAMLRLYAPRRVWEMQNERKMEADGKPLPPYNAAGSDFRKKLEGIDVRMVVDAVNKSARQHVKLGDMKAILLSGIDSVRTMATTGDLREAFPGLADGDMVSRFMAAVERERAAVVDDRAVTLADVEGAVRRLLAASAESVKVLPGALLHEFGNGAMAALDEFSAIIWPDELARFNKMTQGSFIGVGVQIEFDEASYVRVVTPLDGTPAQRAGIATDDRIVKVNGTSIFGLSLDQVVDLITGPQGTPVTLAVERPAKGDGADAPRQELDFKLIRDRIAVASVKGWRREGPGEHEWGWFVDPEAKIGYVRVTQFTEDTTDEFDTAVDAMTRAGVRGLVVDLRFNPGGLLDQAVLLSQRFIDRGTIVMTRGADNVIEEKKDGAGRAVLDKLPVVVLVNRGSASASEIVSGAVQHYGRRGDIPAVVLGQRSYGKGSVQKVWALAGNRGMMKLTTQHYLLPDGRMIHREPGAKVWGVDPDFAVEMLPKQIAEGLTLRKNADVIPPAGAEAADPDDTFRKNLDLQLETAVLLLHAQAASREHGHARLDR